MVEKKFGALRFVSGLFKVFAWIFLILGILGSIGAAIAYMTMGQFDAMKLIAAIGIIIGGVLLSLIWFVIFKATSEIFIVLVAIEYNTRETAYLMRGEQQPGMMAPPPMR
ncbi:MAG: hypothetical protein ACYCZF_17715 [Anaerolineae bacterium]